VVGLCLFGFAARAQAQLTPDDIERLRAQGEKEGWTFIVTENEATHYPLSQLCGAVEPPDWREKGLWDPCTPSRSLPSSLDWRPLGGCTPIRNQGGCGSCWGFAAVGAMESYLMIALGLNQDLSEQWLVSCTNAGNCSGGWHSDALNYLKCNGLPDPCGGTGAVLESAFPYVAYNAPCNCPYAHPYCHPGWYYIGPQGGVPTVDQLKQAILDHGPVAVCVSVNDAFQAYGGGVFNGCENGNINHVVVLVGWDDSQGSGGVWFMRNSWGTGWGEQGYMRIKYNCSFIGYAGTYINYLAESGTTTLPFSDTFPSITIDTSKWTGVRGAEINTLGLNEPSPPNSLDLNGSATGGDAARTAIINTANLADITVSYKWQRCGGGDSPETGDDLIVEYYNSNLTWVQLARYLGSGADMTTFSNASYTLQWQSTPTAFHDHFRVQFRVASSQVGLDDYFIDDVSITTTTDLVPPTNLHWVQWPGAISTTAISMSAHADDPSGVDYFFDATGIGSHSSSWQAAESYTDSGLEINRNYSYRAKARDRVVPVPNETPYTDSVSLATFIEAPAALTIGTVTDTSIAVTAPGPFTRLAYNMSGLFFEVTKLDGTPVGGSEANTWIQTQGITATDLSPATTYRIRIKARNYYGQDETTWYPAPGYREQATTGPACTLAGDVNQDGVLNGLDVAGFVRAKLGASPLQGENQACANYGGTLQEDVADFVADLLGL
jgi:hypothetical protein